jgi:hypothetical protein
VHYSIAQHGFVRSFRPALLDLRVAVVMLGLPLLDEEQATLKFDTLFTLMDGTVVEIHEVEIRPKCFFMSSTKVLK